MDRQHPRWISWIDEVRQDIRYGVRRLIKSPGFTIVAMLTLALGTGANTTMFSVVNGLLLRPLPFDEPHQLVTLALDRQGDRRLGPFSASEYRVFAEASNVFTHVAARTFFPMMLNDGARTRMVEGEIVSTNYFEMLRVSPVLGRFFAPQDDDGAARIVLSHRLWQQGFGGDPEVVGRMIRLRRRAFQVIGVAPAGFNGAMLLIASDYWIPLGVQAALLADGAAGISDGGTDERQSNDPSWFGLVGRLKPDVMLPEAEAQLTTIASRLPRAAQDRAPAAVVVRPATGFGVPAGVRGQVVGPSAILLALGLLVLGVSVTNVACLLLARASTRSREIGVRLALGARPRQVLRQILTENVVLALLGGAAGVVLAYWVSDLWTVFGSSTSEYVSFVLDVRPDARVFVAALLVSACVGVTIGLAPGLQATRIDPAAAMTVSLHPVEHAGERSVPSTYWSLVNWRPQPCLWWPRDCWSGASCMCGTAIPGLTLETCSRSRSI